MQGCPLSGTLFVLAIDPLLTQFEHYIHNPLLGAIYACADDIGAALKKLSHLKLLFQLFEKYRQVSGLTLKPKKCFAILVANQVTVQTVALIRCWLRQNVPSWAKLANLLPSEVFGDLSRSCCRGQELGSPHE